MLMGSGLEGTFGSEISAAGDGWEERGRDCSLCVHTASGYLLLITAGDVVWTSSYLFACPCASFLFFLQATLIISLIASTI